MNIAERTCVGSAIEEACELLPDGWHIEILLEHNAGTVELYDCEGNTHEYPCNYERFSDQIRDAVEYAVNWKEPDDVAGARCEHGQLLSDPCEGCLEELARKMNEEALRTAGLALSPERLARQNAIPASYRRVHAETRQGTSRQVIPMSRDPMRELRNRTPPPDVSQVQPNAGWGLICIDCLHVFRDSAKYGSDFKPDYPCVMAIHSGPSAFIPDLVRYVDGTESCNRYQEPMK